MSKSTFKLPIFLCILEMWDRKCKLDSKIYCKYVHVLVKVIIRISYFIPYSDTIE